MAEIVNGRCHAARAPESPPLVQNGKIVIQAHYIGWLVSSVFTLVAISISFWLINKHLRSYSNKYEQRYIVRILFMVPLYAVTSLASYFWWNHSTPLLLLQDCYESTVLAAFFYLLLLYLSPDPNEQKEIFRKNGLSRENDKERRQRGEPIQKWVFPLGFVRWKPEDGLYFLQFMKWGVLQYCVVRPGTTLAAVILDYVGLYCEDSWGLGWGHVYITIVVSVSVTIAMYCLLQLYLVVKVELAPQKPLLKLFAIKAVVFLTFWQATFLSLLSVFGIVKDTKYMTADNINIGIGAIVETFEMACFACLHIKAFSYKPYYTGGEPTPRWRSLVHAMNFKETGRELWVGLVYMIHRSRGYEVDMQAHREAALENVFGRSRYAIYHEAKGSASGKVNASEKDLGVSVQIEKEVRVGDERQWLGTGDDYVYGLGYQAKRQREGSEGLESQIEKELASRGYNLRGAGGGAAYAPIVDAEGAPASEHQRAQASWWRRMYNRLSQTGADLDVEGPASPPSRYTPAGPRSSSRRCSGNISNKVRGGVLMTNVQDEYNDPPPPSAIRTFRENKSKGGPKRKAPPTLDPPLLFTSFADIPSPLSSPDAQNDSRAAGPLFQYPQDSRSIIFTTPPLLSPSSQSVPADSFFDHAFAGSVEPGSSVEVLSTGPPSSQSHQARVRLGSVPTVIAKAKALPKTPILVDPTIASPPSIDPAKLPPSSPALAPNLPERSVQPTSIYASPHRVTLMPAPVTVSPQSSAAVASPERAVAAMWTGDGSGSRRRSSQRRDSAQFFPESPLSQSPQTLSPLYPSPLQSPRLQRTTAAYSRGMRRNSASPQYTPQPAITNRYTPTRDRIVLPAPLAPGASENAATAPRHTSSSPRYSMPVLPTSLLSSDRRWTAPYSSTRSNIPR